MSTKAKKKSQQRAQCRLGLACFKQQERARSLAAAAQRVESRWHKKLRHLAVLEATLKEDEKSTNGNEHLEYVEVFK